MRPFYSFWLLNCTLLPGVLTSSYRSVLRTFIRADAKDSSAIWSLLFWVLNPFSISVGSEEFLFNNSEFLATSVIRVSLLNKFGDFGVGNMMLLIVREDWSLIPLWVLWWTEASSDALLLLQSLNKSDFFLLLLIMSKLLSAFMLSWVIFGFN